MNYSTSEKIINLFTELLINPSSKVSYSLSYLEGYDIIDFSNAIKLKMAYQIFSLPEINEKKLSELNEYASMGDLSFSSFFLSDDLSEKYLDFKNPVLRKVIAEREDSKSFLNFCLATIHGDRSSFWHKILRRLNLEYETDDPQQFI